ARHIPAVAAAEGDELAHARADARLDVARLGDTAAGDGDDAAGQRFAVHNGTMHGRGGCDVVTDDADVQRQAIVRHFPAGEGFDELALAALRIARWHDDEFDARIGKL